MWLRLLNKPAPKMDVQALPIVSCAPDIVLRFEQRSLCFRPKSLRHPPPPPTPLQVFIDPFGVHVLISLKNGTNHFCHLGKRQEETSPVPCPKMQGKVFESCGWSKHDPSKGAPVLLGDVNGIIWEV